jgi:hypothetical protein
MLHTSMKEKKRLRRCAGFEILMAVTMATTTFWNILYWTTSRHIPSVFTPCETLNTEIHYNLPVLKSTVRRADIKTTWSMKEATPILIYQNTCETKLLCT